MHQNVLDLIFILSIFFHAFQEKILNLEEPINYSLAFRNGWKGGIESFCDL